MPEDVKTHQLYKQIPNASTTVVFDEGSVYNNATSSTSSGWENLGVNFQGNTVGGIAFRDYLDLSGWTQQELTSFFRGFDIQKSQTPIANASVPLIYELDFITTRKLTLTELSDLANEPGFASSTLDLMELIYGQKTQYATNTTVPGTYIIVNSDTSGSGNPTAMNKLHWTRLYVFITGITTEDLTTPSANLVVQAMTAKESDRVWLERLRRSYVLQDEYDV